MIPSVKGQIKQTMFEGSSKGPLPALSRIPTRLQMLGRIVAFPLFDAWEMDWKLKYVGRQVECKMGNSWLVKSCNHERPCQELAFWAEQELKNDLV
jgi:hypothetical protein